MKREELLREIKSEGRIHFWALVALIFIFHMIN